MINASFVGENVARTELDARLRRFNDQLAGGVLPPEARRMYGAVNPIICHDQFVKQYKKYQGEELTLGGMADRCSRLQTSNEIAVARLKAKEGRYVAFTGAGLAVGFFSLMASANAKGIGSTICAVTGVLGLCSLGFGLYRGTILPSVYQERNRQMESFKTTLEVWGRELNATGAGTLSTTAGTAPGIVTDSLTKEEKRELAERLLEEVKAEEQQGPAKVERKDGSVQIGGVSVPVKKPIS